MRITLIPLIWALTACGSPPSPAMPGKTPAAFLEAMTWPEAERALTPETTGLMSAAAFAAMKPSAMFVNVARGKVADEAALTETMKAGKIWAAALDVTADEPLPAASPLWTMPNVFITPHTAGETRAYEDNVLDILMENLGRLWKGEAALRNQVL